jgi:hypothetical protein
VSALPEALPLALSAAIYPPALLVLLLLMTGAQPRRLVLAYWVGAALITIGSGLIALEVLEGASLTTNDSPSVGGGVAIVLGVALLALAAWAWRRRNRVRPVQAEQRGRIAEWSQRAVASRRWALVLGLAMFLPSPLYLLAVKYIADSGDALSSKALAVVICAIGVMLFVEIPLLAMFVTPGGVAVGLQRTDEWLARNGWTLAALLAFAAGIYAIVKGVSELV